jgi:uncharacterized protein
MIARAMSTHAPASTVYPQQLAKNNARWRGEIALSSFARLGELLEANDPIAVDLKFSLTDEGTCKVVGTAKVDARFECQSCLEVVPREIVALIDFRVVSSEQQARQTAHSAEPFLMRSDSVSIAELIEDDLLLSLPTRGCELSAPCPNRPEFHYPGPSEQNQENPGGAESTNPFAVLSELKHRDD